MQPASPGYYDFDRVLQQWMGRWGNGGLGKWGVGELGIVILHGCMDAWTHGRMDA